MAKRKTEEYTFADAYIGSFVKNLMNKNDLMRLAQCKDLVAAEAVLREFNYGEAKELYDGNFESFIRKEQNKHFDLIYDTLPYRKELALLLFPYDYHNVKVCLKSEFLGLPPDENHLVSTGHVDWKKIVAMVRDRNYTFMPVNMKNAIIEATDLFARGGDPQEIDIILDRACYKDMLESAERSDEPFLLETVKLQIDVTNLKTYVRLRQMKKPIDFFKKVFLNGGNVSWNFYAPLYNEEYAQVADKLQPYGLGDVLAKGSVEILESGDFSYFEKICEDKLMEFNKNAKYYSFGLVPIIGYWFAKEVEIDNLRVILTGIMIGKSPEDIFERLREPYV